MIHLGVHVRVEPVLVRRIGVPKGGGLLGHQVDAHDGLDALEPIFPGHHQADRPTLLGRQQLVVGAGGQDGQVMPGLVEAQPLGVGPVECAAPLAGHMFRVQQRLKAHIARFLGGLDLLEEPREGEPQPGDDHRIALDAAHPLDALLLGKAGEEILDEVGTGIAHQPAHLHRPRGGLQIGGQAADGALVGGELVIVVVGVGVVLGGQHVGGRRACGQGLVARRRGARRRRAGRQRHAGGCRPQAGQEPPAREHEGLRGDL